MMELIATRADLASSVTFIQLGLCGSLKRDILGMVRNKQKIFKKLQSLFNEVKKTFFLTNGYKRVWLGSIFLSLKSVLFLFLILVFVCYIAFYVLSYRNFLNTVKVKVLT